MSNGDWHPAMAVETVAMSMAIGIRQWQWMPWQ